jgi:forkhead protein FKH
MVRNAYRIGRGGHRGSSAPSSPSQLNYITHGPRDMAARGPSSARKRRASPPGSPSPRPAFNLGQSTPDRPPARIAGRSAALAIDGSPLPRTQKNTPSTISYHNFNPQSPTLTSSYLQDDNTSFVTPAPPRVHPKLAPPSTAQRPSQHMPTSSPAPFWKYADIGSTPLKPIANYEMSPSKMAGPILPPPSSSPPQPTQKSLPSSPSKPQRAPLPANEPEAVEADDDQGFDLTK